MLLLEKMKLINIIDMCSILKIDKLYFSNDVEKYDFIMNLFDTLETYFNDINDIYWTRKELYNDCMILETDRGYKLIINKSSVLNSY